MKKIFVVHDAAGNILSIAAPDSDQAVLVGGDGHRVAEFEADAIRPPAARIDPTPEIVELAELLAKKHRVEGGALKRR